MIVRIAWYIPRDGNCLRMYMNNKVKTIPINCHVSRRRPKKRPLIFSGMMGCSRANQFPKVMAVPIPNKTIPAPIIQIWKFSGKTLAKISRINPNKEEMSPMLPIIFYLKYQLKN